MQLDIKADHRWHRAEDPARAAANIKHVLEPLRHLGDGSEASALPVALQRNDAVVGTRVVIRRGDRVAQAPHGDERPQVGYGKLQELRVAPAGESSTVSEGHLAHPVSGSQRSDQDLLEDVEVGRLQFECPQHRAAVEAEAAGKIPDGQRQSAAKGNVEYAAQAEPPGGHLRGTALDVTGGDDNVALGSSLPQVFEEGGIVGAVRIQGQNILASGLLEPSPIGAAESREFLGHQAHAVLAYDLLGAIARAAVNDDDLVRRSQSNQRLFQLGEHPV